MASVQPQLGAINLDQCNVDTVNVMAPNNDVNNAVQWLSADAAAHRLGVKIGTLYSYVSRGVIRSHPLSEGKGSRFDRAEVEGLLSRRRSQPGGGADTIVASRITRLHEDGVRYRGHPVEDLAREQSFEEVASMLWDVAHDASPWLVVALPRVPMDDTVALSDRIRVAVTLAALRDEHRPDLRRESVVVSARTLIASVVASLPLTTTNTGPSTDQAWPKQALLSIGGHRRRASVAAALAARLGAQRMTPALVRAVNTALVLVADHELATSTLAARVAASTRADVYSADSQFAASGNCLRNVVTGVNGNVRPPNLFDFFAAAGCRSQVDNPLDLDADPVQVECRAVALGVGGQHHAA